MSNNHKSKIMSNSSLISSKYNNITLLIENGFNACKAQFTIYTCMS